MDEMETRRMPSGLEMDDAVVDTDSVRLDGKWANREAILTCGTLLIGTVCDNSALAEMDETPESYILVHCSPGLLSSGVSCALTPRRDCRCGEHIGSHDHLIALEFQQKVSPWLEACFGKVIPKDKTERNHRFLEEALELVQSCGCTSSEAHQLVDYVFNRPAGELPQEIGGVMVTLAALCLANEQNMHQCGDLELARVWTKIEEIRNKQAAKPKHGPLPE